MTTLPQEYLTTVFQLGIRPMPLPERLAIITAWNPMDRLNTTNENLRVDEALRRTLELKARPYFRATGCSPDLAHREPGWGVEMPKADAIALGKRFSQRAIWWIENGELLLVDCSDGEETAVGDFQLRIVGG
ncbi:DUF3293 domain-containing protein [Luteolibacter flavescens]|uniref:DUF3293 domain-containing protein n=1 Tax=Luteolibacter flavescens TaxID=1859460 RepID=A0ABT3FSI7_9BACT|nr:DUF3293 domain-containing protein [Luteolibacter flavescens]MCW1886517.1 DUF3293 domain-containing protein [Luteolibacter flavescens]